MLARTWPGPEAVAIWAEIVAERTRMILTGAQQDAYNTPMGALFAARTGISRRELADWDASARAWLQIADDAKQLQQKQLLLIIKNVSLPVNEMSGTFSSVTEAWSTAMLAVEKLLSGQPQSASKGAVLLGLASWSLYPDLLVLAEAPTPVLFKDELFLGGGNLTIGLENSDDRSDDGVYWSLALSHLRYYGDPVVSKTSVSQASRISIEELHLLCLGSVLAGWGEEGTDIIAAAELFVVIWERIQQATIDLKKPSPLCRIRGQLAFYALFRLTEYPQSEGTRTEERRGDCQSWQTKSISLPGRASQSSSTYVWIVGLVCYEPTLTGSGIHLPGRCDNDA